MKLGLKLWKLIEPLQGNCYLSDDILESVPDRDILSRARNALYWHEQSAKALHKFLRKNAMLEKRGGE